jgi:8-oxo-dGTP diphosphatase
MSATMRLALGCAPAGFAPLFPADGEYARAAGTLARLGSSGALPAEAVLHLHAYELVERVLDGSRRGESLFSAPLWPPCVFEALGIEVHAWPELASLLPAGLALSFRLPDPGEIEVERLRLGLPAFRASEYRRAFGHAAEAGRWARRFFLPPGFSGEPQLRTAAGFLVRTGRILFERRASDAPVTPGVWDIPGGHIEPREDAALALARELREELGVEVESARLAVEIDALEPPRGLRYRHALFVVEGFRGDPRAREGQSLAWLAPEEALRLADMNPPTGWALQELVERGELDQAPATPRSQRAT